MFRDHCTHYEVSHLLVLPSITALSDGLIASLAQSILAIAQHNFRSLQGVSVEDIVLLSTIPDYPEQDQVELSKEIWSTVSTVVHSVTIALESGASPSVLLNDNAAAAAAIDRNYFGLCCYSPTEIQAPTKRHRPLDLLTSGKHLVYFLYFLMLFCAFLCFLQKK